MPGHTAAVTGDILYTACCFICFSDVLGLTGHTAAATSGLAFSPTLDAISAVTNAVDVLASIQSRCGTSTGAGSSETGERTLHPGRAGTSLGLREMMRRASSAARLDRLGTESEPREEAGIAIPTLTWPPETPSFDKIGQEN